MYEKVWGPGRCASWSSRSFLLLGFRKGKTVSSQLGSIQNGVGGWGGGGGGGGRRGVSTVNCLISQ